jgi:hypothetical protein
MLQHVRQAAAQSSQGLPTAERAVGAAVVGSIAAECGQGCDSESTGSSKDGCNLLQVKWQQQQWWHMLSLGVGTCAGNITALLTNLSGWRRQ